MVAKKIAPTGGGNAKGSTQKVHAGKYVLDEAFNEDAHDLGPWMETPASSRVAAFRYDFMNEALQVTWRNNSNHGYVYLSVPYEGYRSFIRAASKGQQVNRSLNNYPYRPMTDDEVEAPSNDKRKGPTSRARA